MIRGVRGATTVLKDEEHEIIQAVETLLVEMIQENEIHPEKVASVFVSVTEELQSTFPSKALRNIEGWKYVPVVCMQEIPVEGSLPFCIRIMLHLNTDKTQQEIQHVYHGEAVALRPDLKN
ncbi:chorismate mutase [Peribacillus loiseleuriae]|uniref:chorismate mutase n=1 Tax=Peribacillus loiseleuriae TaxID=1679170 RepID=A0A0K9GVE9_9BACI|nr:chorismate mutase [Peribacillus loiseleuriae]KMY50603.1 chorismate mutase [Peribacillus loiseleuriae]